MKLKKLLKLFTQGPEAWLFLCATILSFAFSQAVILSTYGLMDGFVSTLEEFLKQANGDYIVTSRDGFFFNSEVELDPELFTQTSILELKAFSSFKGKGFGVLATGVTPKSFAEVTGLKGMGGGFELAIGDRLASELGVELGDKIEVVFGIRNSSELGASILREFEVDMIVHHGIYEKDLRSVYFPVETLTELYKYQPQTRNKVLLKSKGILGDEDAKFLVESKLSDEFTLEESWKEYNTLIKAIDIEKKTISIALQMIVIVSLFNIVGFIVYVSEKRKKEIFLLRSLGMSSKQVATLWFKLIGFIWLASLGASHLMTLFFGHVILHLPFLKVPGEIYILEVLKLEISWQAQLLVAVISLVWISIIGALVFWRIKKRSPVSGLREEFR